MDVKIDVACPSCGSTSSGVAIPIVGIGLPVRLECPLCNHPLWFVVDSVDPEGKAVYRLGREIRPEEITKMLEHRCPVCGRGSAPSREREYILRPAFQIERHGVILGHRQIATFVLKCCQGGGTPYKWGGQRVLPDGSIIIRLIWDDSALAEKGFDLYGYKIEELV